MSFIVVIPARYASTRFPGKPLAQINNKPMIQHVYERALESGAKEVIVATDDERIKQCAEQFGAKVCVTDSNHQSGTERIGEVIDKLSIDDDEIVVNVQGDEPFIPSENIRQLANNMASCGMPMATLCYPISSQKEVDNPNIVKVLMSKTGKALYFSRSVVPFARENIDTLSKDISEVYFRHIGIYAYRAGFVNQYIKLPNSDYERIESLEQLRVLYHDFDIHVEVAQKEPPHGVDTPEDLQALITSRTN